ncbi:hypothetical protein OPV22_009528 [Ensete ventricosum]|uniref:Cleavage and polyadenylation specificity factor subunit 5 n=1 Tax=Ensete ventricosum TaxID=4639 RepID=A0AAV8R927_ENSVE|nr:hypothetical protein OPV22_009528 [Ensete ventricosum]
MEKDTSVADRLARMKVNYMKEGMRTSVDGILLVQEHNHPHILLLQIGNTFCKLPGGRLKPGENEIEGLRRKLCSKLAANSTSFQPNWQIGECVAIWWRPNFETVMYPYCPPHITKPKECKKLFLVHLSEREYFAVPKNLKLLAVPLFELYDNVQRYGPVISTIPQQLSRFQFNMVGMELLDNDPATYLKNKTWVKETNPCLERKIRQRVLTPLSGLSLSLSFAPREFVVPAPPTNGEQERRQPKSGVLAVGIGGVGLH